MSVPHRSDRSLTLAEWRAEGTLRFGHPDARLWRFACPSCGHPQRAKDLIDMGVPHYERYMAYSCIGRFHLNDPARADEVVASGLPDKGQGCTYSGSEGLAPVLLEISSGEVRRTFEFAP
jgi:hypothetical protein